MGDAPLGGTPLREEPVLFEAVSVPPRSWTPRGFLVLALLLGSAATAACVVFFRLGAWPILGFMGAEIPLVLGLMVLHHRRSGRVSEVLSLTADRLRVRRTDARGRREEFLFQPYWTRVELRSHPGSSGQLRLLCRDRGVEIGRCLSGEDKRDLARALETALCRCREPRFDNPQLRPQLRN